MEQHSENRVTHEKLMTELIEGERNNISSVIDFEIPEIPEALKTPDTLNAIATLQTAQDVS